MQARKMNRFAIAMLQVERADRQGLEAPNCNIQVQIIVDAERRDFMQANGLEPIVIIVDDVPNPDVLH